MEDLTCLMDAVQAAVPKRVGEVLRRQKIFLPPFYFQAIPSVIYSPVSMFPVRIYGRRGDVVILLLPAEMGPRFGGMVYACVCHDKALAVYNNRRKSNKYNSEDWQGKMDCHLVGSVNRDLTK